MINIVGLNNNNQSYNMQIKIDIKNNKLSLNSNKIFKISKDYILNIGNKTSFSYIEKKTYNEINLHFFGFTKGKQLNTSLNHIHIEKELYDDIIIVANKGNYNKIDNLLPLDKKMYINLVKSESIESESIESESESESEFENSDDDEDLEDYEKIDYEKIDNESDILLNEDNEKINLNKLLCKKTIKKKGFVKILILQITKIL